MTGSAGKPVEVVGDRHRLLRGLVTVDARGGDVPAAEGKSGLLVLRKREGGRMERGLGVALLTAVQIRRARKLSAVRVLVAIHAGGELHLENCGTPGGKVTLCARDARVFGAQRKSCLAMVGDRELRGLETFDGVAAFAASAVSTLGELAAVRIGPMAIGAVLVRQRGFEVGLLVAAAARHVSVFTDQRILGRGVIEARREGRALPRGGVMARFASLLKFRAGFLMRIAVARHAAIEFQTNISRGAVRSRRVAFLASDLEMRSRQRISRFRVIEFLRRFPVAGVVTLQAIGAEAPLMFILVAGHACRR